MSFSVHCATMRVMQIPLRHRFLFASIVLCAGCAAQTVSPPLFPIEKSTKNYTYCIQGDEMRTAILDHVRSMIGGQSAGSSLLTETGTWKTKIRAFHAGAQITKGEGEGGTLVLALEQATAAMLEEEFDQTLLPEARLAVTVSCAGAKEAGVLQ